MTHFPSQGHSWGEITDTHTLSKTQTYIIPTKKLKDQMISTHTIVSTKLMSIFWTRTTTKKATKRFTFSHLETEGTIIWTIEGFPLALEEKSKLKAIFSF